MCIFFSIRMVLTRQKVTFKACFCQIASQHRNPERLRDFNIQRIFDLCTLLLSSIPKKWPIQQMVTRQYDDWTPPVHTFKLWKVCWLG